MADLNFSTSDFDVDEYLNQVGVEPKEQSTLKVELDTESGGKDSFFAKALACTLLFTPVPDVSYSEIYKALSIPSLTTEEILANDSYVNESIMISIPEILVASAEDFIDFKENNDALEVRSVYHQNMNSFINRKKKFKS